MGDDAVQVVRIAEPGEDPDAVVQVIDGVNVTGLNPADGDTIAWNAALETWEAVPAGGGGAADSVNFGAPDPGFINPNPTDVVMALVAGEAPQVLLSGGGAGGAQLLVEESVSAPHIGADETLRVAGAPVPRGYGTAPSGRFITHTGGGGVSTPQPAQSLLQFMALELFEETMVDQIGVEVTSQAASSAVRLGIYAADSSGSPGTLVLDAGTVATTATGTKTIAINETLPAGRYYLAAVSQGGAPAYRGVGGTHVAHFAAAPGANLCHSVAGVTGALPDSPTLADAPGPPPRVFLRAA